jgi:hypothetical protein
MAVGVVLAATVAAVEVVAITVVAVAEEVLVAAVVVAGVDPTAAITKNSPDQPRVRPALLGAGLFLSCYQAFIFRDSCIASHNSFFRHVLHIVMWGSQVQIPNQPGSQQLR